MSTRKERAQNERSLMVQTHQALSRIPPSDQMEIVGLAKRMDVTVSWVLRRALSHYAEAIRKGQP
jgi:hypothetical protein